MIALRVLRKMPFLSARKRLEWYPPFFFMRAKFVVLEEDWAKVVIRLPLNAFSKNMGGSMYGGYMASLADPIAALACVKRFPDYSVWTRGMNIDFMIPGNSDLELRFEFDEEIYQKILKDIEETGRSTPTFEYGYYRADGKMCAKVINKVAIRPDNFSPESQSAYK